MSLSLSLFLFILFNFRDGLKYENFQSECLCQTNGKLAFLRTDRDLKKSVSAVLLLGQRSYFCWIANSRRVYCHVVIIKHGVSADERERKQKKTPIFTFKKFPRPLKRECPLTGMSKYEFDGETKQQSKKESVCRTVCLREWELAKNVSVY